MPMVGADICGFYPSPTEELCNRWIELGAFYPFSRDHANFASPRQELYVWESVAKSARNALGMRYKLLPYLYTLNYQAHLTGSPVARPVFFSFPDFTPCYAVSSQFLLGKSVMVSPVLEKGASSVSAMFPPGTWYNLFDTTKVVVSAGPGAVKLEAPLNEINVHVYQNTILPMQRGGVISMDARATPFTLMVAFPFGATESDAEGVVYVDDDERPEMVLAEGQATYVRFYASVRGKAVTVRSEVQMGSYSMQKGMVIEKLSVLGLEGAGKSLNVQVEGADATAVATSSPYFAVGDNAKLHRHEGFEGSKKSVMVELGGLALPLGKSFTMTWNMHIEV
jgi:alpha-D-xyloside xylohydrolase